VLAPPSWAPLSAWSPQSFALLERIELKDRLLMADLNLKTRQAFWETPKGFAAVIAALAITIGAIAGVLGYKIGSAPPQQIIVHLDAPLLVQPAKP
jgi:hypothetical protein